MTTLQDVIQRIRNGDTEDVNWLYIAGSADDLSLSSEADLGSTSYVENADEEILPAGFSERGLELTIDLGTVEECIHWADRLSGGMDAAAVADVIRYYIRFDAFPETLNALDPPSAEECQKLSDRSFADRLGPEDPSKKCHRDGCNRGVVKFSVLCRRHHFESIEKRSYPFDD